MTMVIRDTTPFKYSITESDAGSTGLMKVRGVIQRADTPNANGREYPRSVWEKVLRDKDIKSAIESRRMVGEIDHPADNETSLKRISHVMTSISIGDGGEIIGEAQILDTPNGKILQECFRAQLEVGISSRGSASVVEREDGIEVIQEDYTLDTFDFVVNPSTFGAYPKVVRESKDPIKPTTEEKISMSAEATFRSLRERASKILSQKVSLLSEDARIGYVEGLEGVVVELGKLKAEDASYAPLVEEFSTKLLAKKAALESPTAPPSIDKMFEASKKVIGELSTRLQKAKGSASRAESAKVKALENQLQKANARNRALETKYKAAVKVGNELLEKIKAPAEKKVEGTGPTANGGVIEKILTENPTLAKYKPLLERAVTKGNLDSVVERLKKSESDKEAGTRRTAPSSRVERQGLPLPSKDSKVTRVESTTPAKRVDASVTEAQRLIKNNRLRF